jgi:dynein heavy chain
LAQKKCNFSYISLFNATQKQQFCFSWNVLARIKPLLLSDKWFYQAQTTLINFTVTRDGLEDQLLAAVVAKERPDLEKLKADLTRQQNEFKITLKQLEDSLLARLSAAEGNFLGDYALVENLETTKRTAIEIEEKVKEAKLTEIKINEAREMYRPAAARASLLYFILNDLNTINPIYVFSLKVCISRVQCFGL